MEDQWSEWKKFEATSPYIDWWESVDSHVHGAKDAGRDEGGDFELQCASLKLDLPGGFVLAHDEPEPEGDDQQANGARRLRDRLKAQFSDEIPVPPFAINKDFNKFIDQRVWFPNSEDLPCVDPDTVIVGVIDSGIALGHNRFCDSDGKSRILAAWQQSAVWDSGHGDPQAYLPFGREFYKKDIDQLLEDHSVGGLKGWLDEDAFNEAAGVLDMVHLSGHREVAGRYSHGTHVLDLAAGLDPAEADEEAMRRLKIIAVNLPSRITFGPSGIFLDYFMIYAVRRISDLADAIWKKNHGTPKEGERHGYPVIINLSFGKQAGSKDVFDFFPDTLRRFQKERENNHAAPVHVVMPVGNDNLLQPNALMRLEPEGEDTVQWRVLPEDQTSNYVEIWSELFCNWCRLNDSEFEVPFAVSVVPPGREEQSFPTVPGQAGHVRKLGNSAAIYCQVVPNEDKNVCRYHYVICLAPTLQQGGPIDTAPAGAWKIKVRNLGTKKTKVYLSVQTDQSILPSSPTGLRSYFESEDYERHDEQGRVIDSYNYPVLEGQKKVNQDKAKHIRRHGSMNASASHAYVARVAGYRVSDGKPALYSATGRGRRKKSDGSRGAPTAALPSDDGPAHFGVLAAGARSGSVVAMRGTSFASAQATRQIAYSWLSDSKDWDKSQNERLFLMAEAAEDTNGEFPSEADIEKIGGGRLQRLDQSRVSRTGR